MRFATTACSSLRTWRRRAGRQRSGRAPWASLARRVVLWCLLCTNLALGQTIENSADAQVNGITLTEARVTLARTGGPATFVHAEIFPNIVLRNYRGQSFTYDLLPTINPLDTGISNLEITTPPGYANVVVTGIEVDGVPLTASCPAPGPGAYCATVAGQTIGVTLGQMLTTNQTPCQVRFLADTPATSGIADFHSTVSNGPVTQSTIPGNADGDPGDDNSISVEVSQTQGLVLQIDKIANKNDVLRGEVVTYTVAIRNTQDFDVVDVRIEDRIPPNFKYVTGSARLDGAPAPDPSGNRPSVFSVGTVPALVDSNGNGTADPGEPGFRKLRYQLVVGSGAKTGFYVNTAIAKDYCEACIISNESAARVEVRPDELFDLGTIIGKVFEDTNGDGLQDPGESGVPQAMVALDDGTYVLTDEHGRYHFPAVVPGQRMLKINLHSLPPGALATQDSRRVIAVTPGLMARANFGVIVRYDEARAGEPAEHGVQVRPDDGATPLQIQGSTETLSLLVNGARVPLAERVAHLQVDALDRVVRLTQGRLDRAIDFELDVGEPEGVAAWTIRIFDLGGAPLKEIDGQASPPATVSWDGKLADGELVRGGQIYVYQLEIVYADGTRSTSARSMFGVNTKTLVSLALSGEAFEPGDATLSAKAELALREAAELLRRFPDERVLIDGHGDATGQPEPDLQLARRRAEAALAFLTRTSGLSAERFNVRALGVVRPSTDDSLPQQRGDDRRVEIQGGLAGVERADLRGAHRAEPSVRINGTSVEVGDDGRFLSRIEDSGLRTLDVEVTDSQGRSVRTALEVPALGIIWPIEPFSLPFGAEYRGCRAGDAPVDGSLATLSCTVEGLTEAGNSILVDGQAAAVDADGRFRFEVTLRSGSNTVGVLARNAAGYTRIVNLGIDVSDQDPAGGLLVVTESTPNLSVKLPPEGTRLTARELEISGTTDTGNTVQVNGEMIEVANDGSFTTVVKLSAGGNQLAFRVRDPEGRVSSFEREVEVAKHQLFLLAFADGKLGQLNASGYVEGSGIENSGEMFTEGRLAFYLKGTIAGKYLITTAYDSGIKELEPLFGDLNEDEQARLLRNLDPDRLYPVYGDSSTIVYDVESQGKFFLAVDSETISAVVGNFPLAMTGTELAAYQRTLYGGRFAYKSVSRNRYGQPDTQVVLFGADVRQAHIRDELRATGGSLYYLSKSPITEGSEQVTLVVRDRQTGLVLRRDRQRRNGDYTIKYLEGRLMFHRPIASVVLDGTLVNESVEPGDPVFVEVDYEVPLDQFDETAIGVRAQRQLGDHVSVGGTYVEDEQQSGPYELSGIDAEFRAGTGMRLIAEYAHSEGTDGLTFVSEDGGLSFTPVTRDAPEGTAWKAAAEVDVGEWFGRPGRYQVGAYVKEIGPGFVSSGNFQEQGTQKAGVHAEVKLGDSDSIRLRHDTEDRSGPASEVAGAVDQSTVSTLQWEHREARWDAAVELFSRETEDNAGNVIQKSELAAARFRTQVDEDLICTVEQQQTLSGPGSDQTGVGVQWKTTPWLGLEVRGTKGERGDSAQAGAIVTTGESTIYLTERLTEGAEGNRTSTVVGARSPLGSASQIYTEYQLERSERGDSVISLVGLQRQWDLAPGLRFVFSGEAADADSVSGKTGRSTLATNVSYSNERGVNFLSRNEIRFESGLTHRVQGLIFGQFDYELNPDLTLRAKFRYGKTIDSDLDRVEARLEERGLGLAYRPVAHDRFNLLARYTRLSDRRPLLPGDPELNQRVMDVFSVETVYQIRPRIEWLAKGAARIQDEQVGDMSAVETRTYLVIQRSNLRMWKKFDLGLEYRILGQLEADDLRQGWLSELSWRLHRNFRFGVGYNFTDFSDNEFSQNDYSVHGWFIRVQGLH